jgi:tRNA(adenine34) deaminase
MWQSIGKPWQTAFAQGWEAFTNGSIPIGAVITDENDEIISTGRNRILEHDVKNPKIAHAELECLLNLDLSAYPNIKQYTLYTCMEPCPMCFGAIVMGNLRHLKVAARDSYCGAVYLGETDAYIKSKNINIEFVRDTLAVVQIALQTYFELKHNDGKRNIVIDHFEKDNSTAVRIADTLYSEKYLDACVHNLVEINDVFDNIIARTK